MAAALPIVAAVVGIGSTVYQMVTASQTADYNAQVAEQQATYARQKAEFEAKQQAARMRKLLGEQKVAYASGGVSLLSGSAQDVFGDTLEQGMIDAALIRDGGTNESNAYMTKAAQFEKEGQSALISGGINIGSSLITNFDSLSNSYDSVMGGSRGNKTVYDSSGFGMRVPA